MTLFFVFALFVFSMSCLAKPSEELKKVEQQLNEQKQQAAALDAKAKETTANLQELRRKLVEAAANYQTKEEEQDRLEEKLDQLTQDVDAKKKALKESQTKLNMLSDALIELSRQPPLAWFLRSGLTRDYIHRSIILRAVLPRLREETDKVARDIASLNELQERYAEQKQLAIEAQKNLEGQQHNLDQLIKARQGLLQRTEAQKEAINRQLIALTNEAKDLRQLLEKVAPKSPAGRPRKGDAAIASSLRQPVAGNLVRRYGERDSDGVKSEGLTFTGLPGSPVVAPSGGKVVFAGPFRGYGQIVILQHSAGYHSLLAGFGRIDADMGQEISQGEPLGVLPAKSGGKPELYFEWRHNDEAVDPGAGMRK